MVMSCREIAPALDAIGSLPIDRLWINNLTEHQIQENWPTIMEAASGYDRLLLVSDDAVPRAHALASVIRLLDDGHPVATGYSQLSYSDFRVNLNRTPLRDKTPSPDAYDLFQLYELLEYPTEVVRSFITGFSLCGMSRDMWLDFPFRVYGGPPADNGWASDYHLSWRLQRENVPIVAHRDAFVWHHKTQWNVQDPDKKILCGIEPPSLMLESEGNLIECDWLVF